MALPSSARLTIDLEALAHNYRVLTAEAGGVEAAPVLKGDAYGLGAGPVARRLWAEGARSFFVARVSEGVLLRMELGPERPARILVLDGLPPGSADALAGADLTPVLTSLPQVEAASLYAAQAARALKVGLHLDTGMNRQGMTAADARALAQSPDRLRGLDVELVMSHLGTATDPTSPRSAKQLAAFERLRALFPEAQASLAASAGIFLGAPYRFDLVRPGVSLYGGGPFEVTHPALKQVATFEAPILDVRVIAPGETLGYGDSLRIETPTRVAVVAAGYADGLIRAGKAGGKGWFAGAARPILIVNMDLIVLDIGDAPARPGQMVQLMGPNAPIDDLAAASGTVAHECLVRISERAERVYLGES